MGIFNLFKKEKEITIKTNIPAESIYGERSMANRNIYCELIWKEAKKNEINLIGYNKIHDISVFCGNILKIIHNTSNPYTNIYCPKIIYSIDWLFILKEELKLRDFIITFSDYMDNVKTYTVTLYAINNKNKIVKDTFSSTSKVFIDPFELTDNIFKFLKFAESFE